MGYFLISIEVIFSIMDDIFDYESYDTTENFIIETLDEIISEAVLKNASDIHIEPFEKTVRIRHTEINI